MCREEGCRASALLGHSRHLSWDFPSQARAGPRGASALCLSPGIWHVSAEALGASPEAAAPRTPASWPRPPLSPWRRPASAMTAALSSGGCRGRGEIFTPGPAAACLGFRSRRPDLGRSHSERSSPEGLWERGGGRLPIASGCLRRDPPHTCPPRSGSPLRYRSLVPGAGRARKGCPDLWPWLRSR